MITIDFLIEYQQTVVETLKTNEIKKNLHVEEQILRVLNEVKNQHSNVNGLVTVQMSMQRFRKICEIY